MQQLKTILKSGEKKYAFLLSFSVFFFFINLLSLKNFGQSCPPNIDFESGTFSGWTCYTGFATAVGTQNVLNLTPSGGPSYDRHTMYSGNSGGVDPYGGFPVNCPNGSGNSIKLGNNLGGGQAEGISYEFTIPANQNSYSLIYHYAVVFQAPNHRENEQPRMEIEVTNVTDNTVISCASFTFISVGTSLPGFQVSSNTDTTTVLYKNWSAVTVDLSGNAGKTIRMFFKTADCTFRRHFGYAYIDVDSECSGSFLGATYCPDDTLVNITAPYGYQGYTWYDSALTKVLGTQQVLTLAPPPRSGTTLAVKLEPYNGYGCPNTIYAQVKDSLTVVADAGRDTLSCNRDPVSIGTIPKPGLIYKWAPIKGLSNPTISNPTASPDSTTTYVVTTTNSGGGCRTTDTVIVRASIIDDSLQLLGKAAYCLGYGDSAVLKVSPTQSIQWFKDNVAISGARQPIYRVAVSGTYYAVLRNSTGCSITTRSQTIFIDKALPGLRYPLEYAVVNLPLSLKARQIGETVLWRPGAKLNTANSFAPVFQGTTEQLYLIDIRAASGCITVDTQLVRTVKNVEVYVPTAFTPNQDGLNDFLHPILRGVKEVRHFRIFNRWGQLLFESKNPQPGWNGSFKGIPQQSQAVVWVLDCLGVDGQPYVQKGTSVLLR